MLLTSPIRLASSRPPGFRFFLQDALVALGLPYGPQARESIAQAYPQLFGRSASTLRGYERWLTRSRADDTCESFAMFMDERYRRWVAKAA
ncbi:MAG: hypothetical protein M3069_04835 [Chloroflexota bacterium]|nr:hypothetical protein [Chloroflexota bacterium]